MLPSETLAADLTSNPSAHSFKIGSAPSRVELGTLVALTFTIMIAVLAIVRGYSTSVDNFGDSSAYMGLASAIRHWNFEGIVIKQFWGLPYAMATLSKLTGVSDLTSLLFFSLLPSLLAVMLVRELWDGWIAAYFAVLNFDWLQRSCLGGSEPLFVCCLLAAFFCARKDRWLVAAVFAAFATIVRPLGLFALLGIGITLLMKRDFRRFFAASVIGLIIGILYSLPLALHFGSALANVHSYHDARWGGGWLFGFPFYAIITGYIQPAPWTSLALSSCWIGIVCFGVVMMVRSASFRSYCREQMVEAIFLVPYLWCLFTYNYPAWARSNFGRFSIPILPFVYFALYKFIPKDRRIVWGLAVVCALLAASSAIGVSNVVHMLRATKH